MRFATMRGLWGSGRLSMVAQAALAVGLVAAELVEDLETEGTRTNLSTLGSLFETS